MDNLLQNRLFLQYLSGAGGAISAGQPVGSVLDQITQQNIGAQSKAKLQQSYIKTLQQMLGGLPPDTKVSGDNKGLTLKMPTALSTAQEGSGLEGGSGIDWSDPKEQGQLSAFLREGAVNPSASPSGISGADLAGLTAADVSQALSGATNVQALKQKKFTDIVDALYKSQIVEDMRKRTEIYGRPKGTHPLDMPFPVKVFGKTITMREWKAMPKEDQAYAAYVHMAKQQSALGTYGEPGVMDIAAGLRPDIMEREEWDKGVDKTTQGKYLTELMEDPAMMAAAKELRRSGATKISFGETKDRAKASAEGRQEAKFTDPAYVPDIEARIQKAKRRDPRRGEAETRINDLQKKYNMTPAKARTRAYEEWARDLITKDLEVHYRGKEVVQKSDGWYVDDMLVMENPYAK